MSKHAFFIAGDRVLHVANAAGAGFQYRAQVHVLSPQMQAGPFQHDGAETVLYVTDGLIEVMINGATAHVGAGSFMRIPARIVYGYRNVDDEPARLLCRTAPATPIRDACRITIHLTAA